MNKVKKTFFLICMMSIMICIFPDNKPEIKILTSDFYWGVGSMDETLNEMIIKQIERKLNIKITVDIKNNADYDFVMRDITYYIDKYDVILITYTKSMILYLAEKNCLVLLDDSLNNSALAGPFMSINNIYPKDFDKKYYVPFNRPTSSILFYRKDLLDKYNIKLPESPTPEEFFNEMKKMADNNGGANIMDFPFYAGDFEFFYNAFGAYPYIYKKDGKYIDGFNTDEMKEAVLYVRKLYDNKIISETKAMSDEAQRKNFESCRSALTIDTYGRYSLFKHGSKNFPTDFVPIYRITDNTGKGTALTYGNTPGWIITSGSNNKFAAFKFIVNQVFNPEIREMMSLGIPGYNYYIGPDKTIYENDSFIRKGIYVFYHNLYMSFPSFKKIYKWQFTPMDVINRQIEISDECLKYLGPVYIQPKQFSIYFSDLKDIKDKLLVKIIKGELTIDEAYAEYDKFWKSINGDELLAEANRDMK